MADGSLTRTRPNRRGWLLLYAAAWISCAHPSTAQADPNIEVRRQAIVFGEASKGSEDAVVMLEVPLLGHDCTGTLIAPNLVLTARHCIAKVTPGDYTCGVSGLIEGTGGRIEAEVDPSSITVVVGASLLESAELRSGAEIFHDGAATLCGYDLALLLLDEPVTKAKVARARLDDAPVRGDVLVAVGWGLTHGNALPVVRQRREGLRMLGMGPEVGLAPSELLVSQGACVGDSGGPLLTMDTHEVVGVVARGPSSRERANNSLAAPCIEEGVKNVYSAVFAFADVVRRAKLEARARLATRDAKEDAGVPDASDGAAGPARPSVDGSGSARNAATGCALTASRESLPVLPTALTWLSLVVAATRSRRRAKYAPSRRPQYASSSQASPSRCTWVQVPGESGMPRHSKDMIREHRPRYVGAHARYHVRTGKAYCPECMLGSPMQSWPALTLVRAPN